MTDKTTKHDNIHQALAACNRDIDAIGKMSENKQQGFKFRGIDDAYNTLHDILAKNGVFTVPRVTNTEYGERHCAVHHEAARGVRLHPRVWLAHHRGPRGR